MSVQENLKTVIGMYDAFNKKDFVSGQKLIDDNAQFEVVPFNMKLTGKEGYLQHTKNWATAFPDGFCDVTNISAGEDWAVGEFIGRGTQTGTLMSPDGNLMPTGKRVDIPFCEVIKLKNGKIVSLKEYFDTATMMKQLGLIPEMKHQ